MKDVYICKWGISRSSEAKYLIFKVRSTASCNETVKISNDSGRKNCFLFSYFEAGHKKLKISLYRRQFLLFQRPEQQRTWIWEVSCKNDLHLFINTTKAFFLGL